jgi:hypothetical protein
MRRKARGMEKVENLYCTARAQHAMPRRQRSRDRERRIWPTQAFAMQIATISNADANRGQTA